MDNGNFYEQFRDSFSRNNGRRALDVPGGESWSYGDLAAEVERIDGWLRSLGLEPGDRVSVQVQKSPQALCLYLASLRGGFVFHPLNPGYTASEMDFFLGNAQPALLVCESSRREELQALASRHGVRRLYTLDADGSGSLLTAAAGAEAPSEPAPRSGRDMAALLYSSGTTGVSKGIMLTHDNLRSNARTLVELWGFSSADQLLHALPIYHVHGLFVATHCALLSGAGTHWLPGFDVDAVLAALPRSTVMMGVPTYYTRLLGSVAFDARRCEGMRLFISGSAPLQPATFHAFEERTGHRILERYGMSETGMSSSNPLYGERRVGSVGPPLPGVEARVVDAVGAEVPAGGVGELQVRGPNVFSGYWRLPDKTREEFTEDGFFRTGDQASIDSDGYLSIVGRARDMIITGGLNVYPREVEIVLDAHPQVAESAVFGVPHPDFGEAVVAVLVPAGAAVNTAQLAADLSRQLAPYKLPKRLIELQALPRNSMGKVQKKLLRERYGELFSGS